MEQLSYQTLRKLSYTGYLLENAPERVLQFGEGGFLRAFADYFIDILNEKADFQAKAVLVQPIAEGFAEGLSEQEGLYTVCLRGLQGGKAVRETRVISCVSRCLNPYLDYTAFLDCAANPSLRFLISNTTEAGIVFDPSCRYEDAPPAAFPAKLTRFLHERRRLGLPGFVILSCELIDDNGKELLRCVEQYSELWGLSADFLAWLRAENIFCSTLVDRIVTGFPHAEAEAMHRENGYTDRLLDTAEPFAFWVIEGPAQLKDELPFERCGLPVLITNDHRPYKQRKVRILNGAHTALSHMALLSGRRLVRDCMNDKLLRAFLEQTMYREILPTLSLPRADTEAFAAAVLERFQNPHIDHALASITLNSAAKWKARLLPTLFAYTETFARLPVCISAAFAAYLCCVRANGTGEASLRDEPWVIALYDSLRHQDARGFARAVCAEPRLWDGAFDGRPDFAETVGALIEEMERGDIRAVLERAVNA